MKPMRNAARTNEGGRPGRAGSSAILLAGALAVGGLLAVPAAAQTQPITITSTGTLEFPGTDPADLFGLGTTLATGTPYTLTEEFDSLGPNYYTDGTGTSATDFDPLTGFVTATINGISITTDLTSLTGASLIEDQYGLDASNFGNDSAGDYANPSQDLSCSLACIPYADLMTGFDYNLQPGDVGLDTYSFENAAFFSNSAGAASVSFTGTEASIQLTVPEPASWAVMAAGLLGLGMLLQRRRV